MSFKEYEYFGICEEEEIEYCNESIGKFKKRNKSTLKINH